MKNKVILVDTSMLFVPTVKIVNKIKKDNMENGTKNYVMSACSMYFNSLISCLKKIGVNKDDIVIMALEGRSFRKKLYLPYKAHRQGLRDKDIFVDWGYEFEQLNNLHAILDRTTNFHFVRVADGLEADDIIAISCRYYKDKECVIITGDKDIYMLTYYDNVKIFSTTKKCKGTKGVYVRVKNPLKILSDKATKGDKSDNIIPSINDTKEDYELRYTIVNLLSLPEHIEQKGVDALNNLKSKDLCLDKMPFQKMKDRFMQIYDKQYMVTSEYCNSLEEKRKNKKLKEKLNASKK